MYQEVDGVYEGVGEEGIERVDKVLFPVRQLLFVEEINGGSHINWY